MARSRSAGERSDVVEEYAESVETLEGVAIERPLWSNLALVAAGLTVLVVGSQLLVNGATDIAESAGVSDLVIGLTVVAIGTSLPELATSILAATVVLVPIVWAAVVVGPATPIVAPLVAMTFAVTGFQGWRRHRQTQAQGT